MRGSVLALCLVVVSARASAEGNLDTQFWGWFLAHRSELAAVHNGHEPIADALAARLHAIDPDLTFEVGFEDHSHKRHELIISADGLRRAFPIVQRLVKAAPAVRDWKIVAFRQRAPGFALQYEDRITLDAQSIEFVVVGRKANRLEVDLYVNVPGPIRSTLEAPVFLVLDTVLGEYDVETYLGGIEIKSGADAPPGARPLQELAKIVDALKPLIPSAPR